MSAAGQLLPVVISTQPSFERLVRSVTCQKLYARKSANPARGPLAKIGRQSFGYLPLRWEMLWTAVFSSDEIALPIFNCLMTFSRTTAGY